MGALKRLALVVTLALGLLTTSALSRPAAAASDVQATFLDLGYGDQTARNASASLSYFFTVPPGRALQAGSQVELLFSHSPLLAPDRSTMTVAINGTSVASVFLTVDNASHARLVAPIPVETEATSVFVQVRFSMRLTDDECEAPQNPALWATVHGDSTLTLLTTPSAAGFRLEDIASLYAPSGYSEEPVTLTLSLSPGPQQLEAAGLVAFQVGRWAAAVGRDPSLEVRGAPSQDRPSIFVGTGDELDPQSPWGGLSWNGQAFVGPGGAAPVEHGVLALAGQGAPLLLVSGAKPSAVLTAAQALVRPEWRALLAGDYTILSGEKVAGSSTPPWREGAASFAQLGIGRRVVSGPGEHTMDFVFERPSGWVLRDGGALELALEVSTAARSETSWVAVTVNGQEIGTRRLLAGENATSRYRFKLPAGLLNTDLAGRPLRRLALQIRIYLDVAKSGCADYVVESAWAALLPTSSLLLPHSEASGQDMGRFPSPFLGGDGHSPAVVLPDHPDQAELEAGLLVMAALGRWYAGEPSGLPLLTTASRLGEEELEERHLVLVGGPERNAASAEAVRKSSVLFQLVRPAAYRLEVGERRASLRLGASPWGRDRQALILLAEDTGSLVLAAEALAKGDLLAQLHGRAVAVVADLPLQTQVGAEPAAAVPSALAPRVEAPLVERLVAWQVVGAVLLATFLVLVVIVLVSRWRRRPPPTSPGPGG
ncbi:MAG: cellulose biosynthesis cyclic di-GMP-binding regulatory protein BcsB [Chloroflexota bacterium]|nr:cellulose biosynthesis cyclic di-GMP-binding regulatory protein BcsB [Chloroflexota bacterium]